MMRIISGTYKGRLLSSPVSMNIRPTSDRVRESIFNILSHTADFEIAGSRVLDLFAGTGSLGIEALSRGASFAFFIESSGEGRALLRSNIESLNLGGCVKLSKRDATRLGSLNRGASYNLVFADPPYGHGLGERSLIECSQQGWLSPNAMIVLEERSDVIVNLPSSFIFVKHHKFSDTTIFFYRYSK